MRLTAWQVIRVVTAALVVAAFALLPAMGDVMATSNHMAIAHVACSGQLEIGAPAGHYVVTGNTHRNDCGQFPGEKSNCCLGTFCSSIQMAELPRIDLPAPTVTLSIDQPTSVVTGHGLHPAPSPRPPRLFI